MSNPLEERAKELLHAIDSCPFSEKQARLELIGRVLIQVQAEARELLAAWMIENSFATGHGDTFEDLLRELTWQVAEIRAAKKLAMEPRLILRCQAVHPEVGQCELRAGHEFEKHLAGMILWAGG